MGLERINMAQMDEVKLPLRIWMKVGIDSNPKEYGHYLITQKYEKNLTLSAWWDGENFRDEEVGQVLKYVTAWTFLPLPYEDK